MASLSPQSSTPPLHSSGRESSPESSVGTPSSSRAYPYLQPDALLGPPDKAPDPFAHHRAAAVDELDSDDLLFPDDHDGSGLTFVPDSTQPHICVPNDAMPSPPINIATPRQPSNSPPRNQQSNLTSQLRQPQPDTDMDMDGVPNNDLKPRQESVSMLSTTPFGAKAIPVRDGMGFRRESHVGLSGSLMGGMSWGGLSMGSFVRDE